MTLQKALNFGRSIQISNSQATGIGNAATAISSLQVNKANFLLNAHRHSTKTRPHTRVKTCLNCG